MIHSSKDAIIVFNESTLDYRSLPRYYIGDVNFERVLNLQNHISAYRNSDNHISAEENDYVALITDLSINAKAIYERAMKMTYNEIVNYYNGVYKRNTNKETRFTVDELFDVRYRLYEFMIGLIITATERLMIAH